MRDGVRCCSTCTGRAHWDPSLGTTMRHTGTLRSPSRFCNVRVPGAIVLLGPGRGFEIYSRSRARLGPIACGPLHADHCMRTVACGPLHADHCMRTIACGPLHAAHRAALVAQACLGLTLGTALGPGRIHHCMRTGPSAPLSDYERHDERHDERCDLGRAAPFLTPFMSALETP